MKRTIENCTLIKRMVKRGDGEPEHDNNKCLGYGGDTDEPCNICKNCSLNNVSD